MELPFIGPIHCPFCGEWVLNGELKITPERLQEGIYVHCPHCKMSWELRWIEYPDEELQWIQ